MNDTLRLSKLMAQKGLCSRREADEFIQRGWVKVNGKVCNTLGTKVYPNDEIVLLKEAQKQQDSKLTIILNKPPGYVSAQAELDYLPAIRLITANNRSSECKGGNLGHSFHKGLAPAGRLDIDSTGLLILTQDGRLAKKIIGENSEIEKEYEVGVEGELSDETLRLLRHGLELDGKPLKPAKVEIIHSDKLRFVLKEGKKRQIRRMCELVHLRVKTLQRVRIGQLRLGNLKRGEWRTLSSTESI